MVSEAEKKKNAESRNGAPSKEEPKAPKERVPSQKKPEVSKEKVPSEKKPEVSKERVPSEKKPEASKERVPSEKKPTVTIEKAASGKEPPCDKKQEVPKQRTPSEKTPEVTIERRERAPSGGKPEVTRPPIMGVKPFGLPRDRVSTETASRAPSAQPRDRASTGDKGLTKPAPEEPAKPRGPPKFGIGIGGAAGGGLLAEMKLRQERAASLGRVSKQ